MKSLSSTRYDLLVVGGGIYGACAAWDAAQRGLSVALIEQGDFGHATSANSMKIVHGGFRYLQHGDLTRIRESIRERRAFLRIAPHLVRPLPCVLPTYGHGMMGPEAMRVALAVYDAIGWDRNQGLQDPGRRVPRGRALSRQECLRLFPGIRADGLTGAALWYDGQMRNSERLTLAFVRSAVGAGAAAANYVRMTALIQERGRAVGARVVDELSGQPFEIRAQFLLNTSGPWVERVAGRPVGRRFCKTLNLVIRRPLLRDHGLAVSGPAGPEPSFADGDALVKRASRLLFISPWGDRTIIGSPHLPSHGDPDRVHATPEEIESFLQAVNQAYPAARVTLDDVSFVHQGLMPMAPRAADTGTVDLAKHAELIDHARDGLAGLISVIGVKYTTARLVAERAVDQVVRALGAHAPASRTATTPVAGGAIVHLEAFMAEAMARRPAGVSAETIRHLIEQYGADYGELLRLIDEDPSLGQPLSGTTTIGAEVVQAARSEMAQTLRDVVFRRTELGSGGDPGEPAIWAAAALMGQERGWSADRRVQEINAVHALFPHNGLAACLSL